MACKIVSMVNEDECIDASGGVITSFLVEGGQVEDVEFDADGHITSVTLASAGAPIEFEPADNDTAYFNSTGERVEDNHRYNQEYFGQFKGVDDTKVESANGLSRCCNIVAFHFLDNGTCLVQGVEWLPNAASGDPNWRFPKQKGKPRVNVFSGTGAESNRVEIFLNSVTKYVALCKLTKAEIEDL